MSVSLLYLRAEFCTGFIIINVIVLKTKWSSRFIDLQRCYLALFRLEEFIGVYIFLEFNIYVRQT